MLCAMLLYSVRYVDFLIHNALRPSQANTIIIIFCAAVTTKVSNIGLNTGYKANIYLVHNIGLNTGYKANMYI